MPVMPVEPVMPVKPVGPLSPLSRLARMPVDTALKSQITMFKLQTILKLQISNDQNLFRI